VLPSDSGAAKASRRHALPALGLPDTSASTPQRLRLRLVTHSRRATSMDYTVLHKQYTGMSEMTVLLKRLELERSISRPASHDLGSVNRS